MIQTNAEAAQVTLKLVLAVEQRDHETFYALWNEQRGAEEWKLIAGQAVKLLWDLWITEAEERRELVAEYLRIGTAEKEMAHRLEDIVREADKGNDASSLEWVLKDLSPALTRKPLGGR
jgi:hypothetical protein